MSEKLRLLICNNCVTVEELPDYDGPERYDHWLNDTIKANHTENSGTTHVGNLVRVEQSDWLNQEYRRGILAEIHHGIAPPGHGEGLGQAFYDTKSNYLDDAMHCWRVDHGRTLNCEDFRSDKKRLLPDTKAERKDLGLDMKTAPNTFLCDFCPYNTIVEQKKREKAGQYK